MFGEDTIACFIGNCMSNIEYVCQRKPDRISPGNAQECEGFEDATKRKKESKRLYTFINFYLSSIQQGIQTAHILGELFNRYDGTSMPKQTEMVRLFNRKFKTIVVCNGGNGENIRELIDFFANDENPFPWAVFHEDVESLDGALTGIGIVLPEHIYEVKRSFENVIGSPFKQAVYRYEPEGKPSACYDDPSSYMYQLVDRVKSAPLAR